MPNVVRALQRRERCADPTRIALSTRTCWRVHDVLSEDDDAVLLGFSNNGRYLLYYKPCEQGLLKIYWRMFSPTSTPLVSRHVAVTVTAGPCAEASLGMHAIDDDDMELRVWESIDESLVVAIASVGRPGTPCHVAVASGPSCRHRSLGALRLTLATSVPVSQCWFFIASTTQLVLHGGSSLLLFSLYSATQSVPFQPLSTQPWYHASEFPVVVHVEPNAAGAVVPGQLQCGLQLTFDIESFLRHLLDSVRALRPFRLQDYDLRFLCMADRTWMHVCVVVVLEPSNPAMPRHRQRVGIFAAWNVVDGAFHTLRVLSMPPMAPLATAATALAAKCRRDIHLFQPPTSTKHATQSTATSPSDVAGFTLWTNLGVVRGTSLHRVDNPVFPITIARA
ncbi:hypothetical protein H310_10463 [Aphanomyces invadans]|uniref:DDB1- and CUL4-associated factor 15 WD40 repeat-containing domain-containing protein n=1 Tax=Aphanomyces invadans TaxID=157072 RepID=A0A024TQI7_9STRA|nr:hypothetical protein H310_10463 [Aphanomyces invadans]ETV96293.1 hypothetical protein H310_10463 [Aphanomyces invadans]|eukprot:XP_008875085.1 hypothetical protein H310_10463 [Aphanomyces invadans]